MLLSSGVARIFPWTGGGAKLFFLEKCSLLVDRLGCPSERYIEIEQKGGWPGPQGPPPLFLRPWLRVFSFIRVQGGGGLGRFQAEI